MEETCGKKQIPVLVAIAIFVAIVPEGLPLFL